MLFNNFIKKLLSKYEVDRAVVFGILTKFWTLFAGSVSIVLIALFFSPEVQGYYYTFTSLLALQILVELGLSQVIIQFASHEWSELGFDKNGRITGSPNALSRLVSIGQITLWWYATAGCILAVGLGIGGYVFFSGSATPGINWVGPWLLLCLMTGIKLFILPFFSLLEGCNQVSEVYGYRLIEGIVRFIFMWIPMVFGAGLWTPAISTASSIILAFLFLHRKYNNYFSSFFSSIKGPRVSWKFELWPLQWRIALSWLSGYFVFNLFTPILFHYHGPVIAGRMGMTWSLIILLSSVAGAFVAPKAPRFGMMIAQKNFLELDRLFWRITKVTVVVTILIAGAIWVSVYVINSYIPEFAMRILPPLPTGFFLLATVLVSLTLPMSTYLRAHKREPLLFLSVLSAILIGFSSWFMGKYYSVTGMAAGYLLLNMIIIPLVVLVWHRCRRAWHIEPIISEPKLVIEEDRQNERVLV